MKKTFLALLTAFLITGGMIAQDTEHYGNVTLSGVPVGQTADTILVMNNATLNIEGISFNDLLDKIIDNGGGGGGGIGTELDPVFLAWLQAGLGAELYTNGQKIVGLNGYTFLDLDDPDATLNGNQNVRLQALEQDVFVSNLDSVILPALTLAKINAAGGWSAVTKEWVEDYVANNAALPAFDDHEIVVGDGVGAETFDNFKYQGDYLYTPNATVSSELLIGQDYLGISGFSIASIQNSGGGYFNIYADNDNSGFTMGLTGGKILRLTDDVRYDRTITEIANGDPKGLTTREYLWDYVANNGGGGGGSLDLTANNDWTGRQRFRSGLTTISRNLVIDGYYNDGDETGGIHFYDGGPPLTWGVFERGDAGMTFTKGIFGGFDIYNTSGEGKMNFSSNEGITITAGLTGTVLMNMDSARIAGAPSTQLITKDYLEKYTSANGGGIPDAPSDGTSYARKDGEWTTSETGVLAVDEGKGFGLIPVWATRTLKDTLGGGAMDFSRADSTGVEWGAIGDYSLAMGDNVQLRGYSQFGNGSYIKTGYYGGYNSTIGYDMYNGGWGSFALGAYQVIQDQSHYTFVGGTGNNTGSSGLLKFMWGVGLDATGASGIVVFGEGNVRPADITGGAGLALQVGNGDAPSTPPPANEPIRATPSDAFRVFKNGKVEAPSLTVATINGGSAYGLTTKEWVEQYVTSGTQASTPQIMEMPTATDERTGIYFGTQADNKGFLEYDDTYEYFTLESRGDTYIKGNYIGLLDTLNTTMIELYSDASYIYNNSHASLNSGVSNLIASNDWVKDYVAANAGGGGGVSDSLATHYRPYFRKGGDLEWIQFANGLRNDRYNIAFPGEDTQTIMGGVVADEAQGKLIYGASTGHNLDIVGDQILIRQNYTADWDDKHPYEAVNASEIDTNFKRGLNGVVEYAYDTITLDKDDAFKVIEFKKSNDTLKVYLRPGVSYVGLDYTFKTDASNSAVEFVYSGVNSWFNTPNSGMTRPAMYGNEKVMRVACYDLDNGYYEWIVEGDTHDRIEHPYQGTYHTVAENSVAVNADAASSFTAVGMQTNIYESYFAVQASALRRRINQTGKYKVTVRCNIESTTANYDANFVVRALYNDAELGRAYGHISGTNGGNNVTIDLTEYFEADVQYNMFDIQVQKLGGISGDASIPIGGLQVIWEELED